jgi:hypothetical protein
MTVRCPECGTINSGQSKFCSACGHQVRSQTAGRCPECGAQNPPNNIFCDECGHRLVPADPALESRASEGSVRGLSLPRKENSTEQGVPDWLARLRASFSEDEEGGSAGSEETAEGPEGEPAADEAPSWLDDLSGLGVGPAEEEGESRAGKPESPTELPDWLREAIGRPVAAEEEEPEEEAGKEAAIAWQVEVAEEDEEPVIARQVEPEQVEAAEEDEEPADWLAKVSADEPAEEEAGLPIAADEADVSPPEEGEPGPGTLEDETETTAAARQAPPSAADVEEMEPGELAGWLESLSDEPMIEELETSEEKVSELPDWLQSVALEAGDLGTEADSGAEDAGLPDWLQALDLEEIETAGAKESGDWLQEFSVDEERDETGLALPEPLTADQPKAQEPGRPRRPQTRLPSTGPLVPDELKEWLGDTIGEEDEGMAESRPAVKGTGPLVPPELPDWLAAVEDVPSTGELPGWLLREGEEGLEEEEEVTPEVRPADRPRTAPLPSWLKDDLGAVPVEDEAEAVPGEIPD